MDIVIYSCNYIIKLSKSFAEEVIEVSISKYFVTALVAMILQNNLNNVCSIEPLSNYSVVANDEISIVSVKRTFEFSTTKTVYTISVIDIGSYMSKQ